MPPPNPTSPLGPAVPVFRRRLGLPLLVALACVGSMVLLWSPRDASGPAPGLTVSPRDDRGAEAPEAGAKGALPATAGRPAPGPPGLEAPAVPLSGPEDSVDDFVSGRVLAEETLAGLPGALVRLAVDLQHPGNDGAAPPEIVWLRSAQTDALGSFRLEGLPPGPYRIAASSPGRLDRTEMDLAPGADLVLALPRHSGTPCVLELLGDPEPWPLPWTKVVLALLDASWTLEAETDARGVFQITGLDTEDLNAALAADRVRASVPGYASPTIGWRTEEDATGLLHVSVEAGRTVRGRTVDARTGRPIAEALVVTERGHGVATDGRGGFEIRGVEEGIAAFAEGYAPAFHDVDPAGDALALAMEPPRVEPSVDLRLEPGLDVRGRVAGPDGEPLAGAKVRVAGAALVADGIPAWSPGLLGSRWSATTDAEGAYEIPGLPAAALGLPGILALEVSLPHWDGSIPHETGIVVAEGEARSDVTLALGALEGRIRGRGGSPLAGSPLAGATVVAVSETDGVRSSTRTSGSGAFLIPSFPSGPARVVVAIGGRIAVAREVAIPGPPIDLVEEDRRSLDGLVALEAGSDPVTGAVVRLFPEGFPALVVRSGRTDAAGEFSFEGVPPGPYVLEVRAPSASSPFDAPAPEHREIVDLGPGDWSGRVTYPSLPSAEVTFRFERRDAAGALSPLGSPVELRVLRYARGGFLVGGIRDPRGPPRHWVATGEFRERFREGEYTFRIRTDMEGTPIIRDETIRVVAGEPVERAVAFDAPR